MLWSQQVLADGRVDAVVLNSGGANACTGAAGLPDTHATAEHVARRARRSRRRRRRGLLHRADRRAAADGPAARRGRPRRPLPCPPTAAPTPPSAIMTTDTVSKQVARRAATAGRVGGMAKGAGMLAPALATMLVRAHHRRRRRRRPRWTRRCGPRPATTFDRIDSDGCMSTNDTVLLLASGASGVTPGPDELDRRRHRGLRRPGPAAASPTPRAPPTTSRSRCATPRPRPRRARGRPRGRPQQPVQVRDLRQATPTGAGSSPRSAPPRRAFEPGRRSTSPSTASRCAAPAASARTAPCVDLQRPRGARGRRPARRRRDRPRSGPTT